jgi:endoglucanase Acf2
MNDLKGKDMTLTRCLAIFRCAAFAWLGFFGLSATAQTQTINLGLGAYTLRPKGQDPRPPAAPFRTPELQKQAAPTNQWYSTLVFHEKPEAIFAHPLSVKATAEGLEVALPRQEVVPTERKDVEIHYAHKQPVRVSSESFTAGKAKLARVSDWSIDISQANGSDQFLSTVTHGSPYVYFQTNRGNLRIDLPNVGQKIGALSGTNLPLAEHQLALQVNGQIFVFFAPTGAQWEAVGDKSWRVKLPENKGYMAMSVLPEQSVDAFKLVQAHAYAFVSDTQVSWQFDSKQSQVKTDFAVRTKVMEGSQTKPLLGLYPHHWHQSNALSGRLTIAYDSIRGPIKLLAADSFSTTATYNGFVPFWPGLQDTQQAKELHDIYKTDVRNARRMMLEIGVGPYWQGKGLQRITKLMDVVEQQGDLAARDQLLSLLKKRIEQWFSGKDLKTYFYLDRSLGAVIAYPEEYFSIAQMNDHHFHYGYWIRAMADIALRDPEWASNSQWGGLVNLLIADIATGERGRADFPFLRNFDPYEGHSWASGVGLGTHGNNQESSSEAINAWAGLIQWGELTGNPQVRDLGLYLYTTEIQAIHHYWFDSHGLVFPKAYQNAEVSMVFGGKYAHNTWWTDEPRQIKGINLLPITTASLYLGLAPDHVRRSVATLPPETAVYASRGKYANPPDIWQDIFAKYLALAEPAQGLAAWNRWGSFELGDTRSHTLHWLYSLNNFGAPDFSVTANTIFYSVFKNAAGRRTYLAYNPSKNEQQVLFSDGKRMRVAAGQLAQEN